VVAGDEKIRIRQELTAREENQVLLRQLRAGQVYHEGRPLPGIVDPREYLVN
jgi:hypothetical protein